MDDQNTRQTVREPRGAPRPARRPPRVSSSTHLPPHIDQVRRERGNPVFLQRTVPPDDPESEVSLHGWNSHEPAVPRLWQQWREIATARSRPFDSSCGMPESIPFIADGGDTPQPSTLPLGNVHACRGSFFAWTLRGLAYDAPARDACRTRTSPLRGHDAVSRWSRQGRAYDVQIYDCAP